MKSNYIKSSSQQEPAILLQCSCGCGLLEVRKYKPIKTDPHHYLILYYSTHNLRRRDKFAWDILLDEEQFNDFVDELTKLKEAK